MPKELPGHRVKDKDTLVKGSDPPSAPILGDDRPKPDHRRSVGGGDHGTFQGLQVQQQHPPFGRDEHRIAHLSEVVRFLCRSRTFMIFGTDRVDDLAQPRRGRISSPLYTRLCRLGSAARSSSRFSCFAHLIRSRTTQRVREPVYPAMDRNKIEKGGGGVEVKQALGRRHPKRVLSVNKWRPHSAGCAPNEIVLTFSGRRVYEE